MRVGDRIVVIGASGAGKTTIARALGTALAIDVLELDTVHWTGKVGSQRDECEAKGMVSDFTARSRWIVEGVYGWLVAPAIPRADTLIWLDFSWTDCQAGLAQRGPWRGATSDQHAAFLAWAEDYWTRTTSCSFAGHQSMYDAFAGTKLRPQTRADVSALLTASTCVHRRAFD